MGDPVVELLNGSIRGSIENHEEGFSYYAFKGIPYAEPPLGKLRFMEAVPKRKWTGILDCIQYSPILCQFDWYHKIASYNEDGLYLNVFTHEINDQNAKKPVMMVVHGGAYMCFSGCDFYTGAEYLIRKDLVVVTINYRLGVLGFLNLEDEIAPGNQGFKDMVLALRWIQQNIQNFGGDPNNVTAFGASAGATAVHFLALSPLTKGIIHKVISQSSVAYNHWAFVKNPREIALKLCSLLGKELTDPREIVEFLQTVDSKLLLEAHEKIMLTESIFPFGPSIDSKSTNPFMPAHPFIAADKGVHLPYLVGYSAREGLILLSGEPKENVLKEYNRDPKLFFKYNAEQLLERYDLSTTQVKRLYYKSEAVSDKNLDNFVNLMNDVHFVEGIHKFARVQADRSSASTYMYVFDYDAADLISKKVLKDSPGGGAGHMDDTPFVLKMRFYEQLGIDYFKKGTKSYRIMEQMTEMWANFAKYGRPTIGISELIPVNWLPIVDGTLLRYLSIDEDLLMKFMLNVDLKLLSAKSIIV